MINSSDIDRAERSLFQVEKLIRDHTLHRDGLIDGRLGKVLYLIGCYKYFNKEEFRYEAEKLIQLVFSNIGKKQGLHVSTSLSNGLTGLGITLSFLLEGQIIDLNRETKELLQKIDRILFEQAIKQIGECNIDFLHSSMGTAHYLTRRSSTNPKAKSYLYYIVKSLYDIAIKDERGMHFQQLKDIDGQKSMVTYFGIAHGMSGILLILIKIFRKGVAEDLIYRIVSESIRFMLYYRKYPEEDKPKKSLLPMALIDNHNFMDYDPYRVFMGWCNGDLGKVLLLSEAGRQFNNLEWMIAAQEIGKYSLEKKNPSDTGIQNTCFCHGSSGIAQLYKRLYDVSSAKMYLDGYHYWLNDTFSRLDQELNQLECIDRSGQLLNGWSGAGLVLLSRLIEDEFDWDSIFLLS